MRVYTIKVISREGAWDKLAPEERERGPILTLFPETDSATWLAEHLDSGWFGEGSMPLEAVKDTLRHLADLPLSKTLEKYLNELPDSHSG